MESELAVSRRDGPASPSTGVRAQPRPRRWAERQISSRASRAPVPKPGAGAGAADAGAAPGNPDRLTRREVEVLRLVAAGHSNRQIAAALFLSARTVERHVANLCLKVGAHSKA